MDKWRQGVEERERMKKKQSSIEDIASDGDAEVEEVSVVNPQNAINPVLVEGKKAFHFDVGQLLVIKYIATEPPEGCEWMGQGSEFKAQVVKCVLIVL